MGSPIISPPFSPPVMINLSDDSLEEGEIPDTPPRIRKVKQSKKTKEKKLKRKLTRMEQLLNDMTENENWSFQCLCQ